MSGAFSSYSLIWVAIGSLTLSEEAKLTLKRKSGAIIVGGVAGLAGVSPGAPMVSGTI